MKKYLCDIRVFGEGVICQAEIAEFESIAEAVNELGVERVLKYINLNHRVRQQDAARRAAKP